MMRVLCLLPVLLTWYLSKSLLVGTELQEQNTLLAINKELRIQGWDANNSNYCSWQGVTCGHDSLVEKLNLSHQNLGGNVTLMSKLKALQWLDISNNNFHGLIPSAFGNLSDLEVLDLSSNKFEGSIPPELGALRSLKSLNISNNLLVGEIPKELQGLENLQHLQISSNHLTGLIPSWIGNFTNLRAFSAYENHLNGRIPDTFGSISELQILNLHSNQLEGQIPRSIFSSGKLEVLVLSNNHLSGVLPEEIGKCQALFNFRIGNNDLVGNIPKNVGNLTSLTYFEANNNNFYGELVSEFSKCSNLILLNLASNGFTGTIPPEFGQLMNLQGLILSGNLLSGEIPKSILQGKNLTMLDIRNNKLNGTIPSEIFNIFQLKYLLLSQNSIRGVIPREIGKCGKLIELQLGSNYLSGTIPSEIGNVKNLEIALNLSYNHLQGPLPPELGRLDKLVSLDVSNNCLLGNIPAELSGMSSLVEANFSNNRFIGPVPDSAAFLKNPTSGYLGNKGLCGEPLNTTCGGDFHEPKNYNHKDSFQILETVLVGSSFVLSLIAVVFICIMRKRQKEVAQNADIVGVETRNRPNKMFGRVFVDNLRQAVNLDVVVKATLNDSNKVSSGTFSAVYKAFMPSGIVLFVRKLKHMEKIIMHHQRKIIAELEKLSKLSHENIMQLIGYVIYNDVALLIYQCLPNGTLTQLLHESTKQPEYQPDWPVRLGIAIGVAQGLAFLHYLGIILLDISSKNVLLDANFKPFIGDIEISKLLDPTEDTARISIVAGSFGYIPPEYAYTMQVTAPGNVYSFGAILLEMLTTRPPVDKNLYEGVDLVKWVHGAAARGETPEQILDARLSTVSFGWRKKMLSVLKVAMLCTDHRPSKRPKMKQVVEMLLKIRNK